MRSNRSEGRIEMQNVLSLLIERDGRKLFLDDNYTATALVKWDDSLEVLLREVQEDRDLYMAICDLQDEEIQALKRQLQELQEK
jgi:polyhydroxyalkanoate synthesis regulator phasin